jgi:hypothetical protein
VGRAFEQGEGYLELGFGQRAAGLAGWVHAGCTDRLRMVIVKMSIV